MAKEIRLKNKANEELHPLPSKASATRRGGVKIGYTNTGRNLAVRTDAAENAYVALPSNNVAALRATTAVDGLMSAPDKAKLDNYTTTFSANPNATQSAAGLLGRADKTKIDALPAVDLIRAMLVSSALAIPFEVWSNAAPPADITISTTYTNQNLHVHDAEPRVVWMNGWYIYSSGKYYPNWLLVDRPAKELFRPGLLVYSTTKKIYYLLDANLKPNVVTI